MPGDLLRRVGSLLVPLPSLLVQNAGIARRVPSQPRIIKIRERKMRKFKRRKRIDRDWFQYKRKHLLKKQKSETLFRARMEELVKELERFDPMEYVKETMTKAKKEWHLDAAPSGRRRYPHWSTLMSLEELFGIEKDDHIDKRYGLPTLEERPLIDKFREDYHKSYIVKDPVKLLNKLDQGEGIARIGEATAEKIEEKKDE